VTAISISKNDKYVVAADAAEKIECHVFKIDGPSKAIATVVINAKVMHLAWSPHDENVFACGGDKHMNVCTLDGDKITMKKGSGGGGVVPSSYAVSWVNDPARSSSIISAGADGKVHHWDSAKIAKSYAIGKGSVKSVVC